MPTIKFNTYHKNAFDTTKPILTKSYKPDWWKKIPVNDIVRGNVIEGTIKTCPAMHDWLNMGWLIVANRDITVKHGKVNGYCAAVEDLKQGKIHSTLPSHPKEQVGEGTDYQFNYHTQNEEVYDAFKVRVEWSIKLPKGYSMMYLDPFLWQNKDFKAWNGVIDSDKGFNHGHDNSNIIMYPKHGDDFVIKKGTPLVQVIPFKREEWESEYHLQTSWNHYEDRSSLLHPDGSLSNAELLERNKGSYKKDFWTPKTKLFKDAKGGCPFDHDTPETKNEVQMEFDFK
jgi:hypothetical protein